MKIWRSDEAKAERYLGRLESRMTGIVSPAIESRVRKVIATVQKQGDRALSSYVRRYDLRGVKPGDYALQPSVAPVSEVGEDFANAVEHAIANLEAFHEAQAGKGYSLEHASGDLGLRVRPLDSVAVYVPDRDAVHVSSLLMAVVPARLAGVGRIAVATPPRAFLGSPQLRYVLDRLDLREVYLMGGPHAFAALAFGTASVTPVDKIVGSGGRWAAAVKRLLYGVVGVDLLPGPAEIVVIADGKAEPDIVAADLLAQVEHDPDAIGLLLTTSKTVAEKAARRLDARLRSLPKASPARVALRRWGAILLVRDLAEATLLANRIAPEHLEILTDQPRALLDSVDRAGAVYLGPFSSVVLADYVVGTNHLLPTAAAARFGSPLGVWDFVRRSAVVDVAAHRYARLARTARTLAAVEDLPLHAEALTAGTRGAL